MKKFSIDPRPPEERQRRVFAPLYDLYEYVTLELPSDLEAVRQGAISSDAFRERCIALAEKSLPQLDILSCQKDFAVAHLDIMMLFQSLQSVCGDIPTPVRTLHQGVVDLYNFMPAILTYEDIVLQNPQEDPRTFMRGTEGTSEMFFYDVHRAIEHSLTQARCELMGVLGKHPIDTRETLERAAEHIEHVGEYMKIIYETLHPDHFTAFRPYLNQRVDRQHGRLPGPSGNYSAGMFTFDLLAVGKQPHMVDLLERKATEIDYFPVMETSPREYDTQSCMRTLSMLFDEGSNKTLEDIAVGEFRPISKNILQCMKDVRDTHVQIFSKFVGTGLGTAGKAPEYLTLAPRAYEHAISSLS